MERSYKPTRRESVRDAAQVRWGPAHCASSGDLAPSLRRVVLGAAPEAEAAVRPREAA